MQTLSNVSAEQVRSERRQALARKIIDLQSDRVRFLSYEDMRVLTQYLSLDPNWKAQWLPAIDRAYRDGTLNQPHFVSAWKRSVSTQFTFSSLDPKSESQFDVAYAYLYPSAGIENYWQRNPYWFVKELGVEGQAGLISGDRGYGKTDHALLLCELLIQLKQDHIKRGSSSHYAQIRKERRHQLRYEQMGFGADNPEHRGPPAEVGPFSSRLGLYDSSDLRIPTNISISPKSDYAEYFQKAARMSEFVILTCQNAMHGHFSLLTLDEMGFSFNKRRAMTVANFGIEQLLILIRKFNAGLWAIAQSLDNQLPVSLTGSAQTKVEKVSKDTAIYNVRGLFRLQRVRNIPRTSVLFATRAFAPFAVDMIPSVLVEAVAQKEQDTLANREEWTDAMMYQSAIDWCIENRASPEEIAKGKSGILRSQVRWMATQIDPETGRLWTPERIAIEMEGVDVSKVREILDDARKEARLKRGTGKSDPTSDR